MGFARPHYRQVAHLYYQLLNSKMADGDQLWSVPKFEYDLLRRNASTNVRKTDLIERYISGADPGFQVRGCALKNIAPNGGRRENVWGLSCEKSRFYAKKSYFFQF